MADSDRGSWRPGVRIRVLVAAVVILATIVAVRAISEARRILTAAQGRTTISQQMIAERVRTVAQLVSTEMSVRDVVTYENTRYGSTKRSLLVATARILAGIDLEAGSSVKIDSAERRILITLPEARILAVDIQQLRTYDEQRGLWNPFEPEDRDVIYQQVRRQLFASAEDMGIVQRANRSAAAMLETMFSVDGYVAEVRFVATGVPTDGR
jgi:hypothetical protein